MAHVARIDEDGIVREVHVKRCPACEQHKPLDAFNKADKRPDGKRIYCRECESAKNRAWAARNRDRERERTRHWAQKNKDKVVGYTLKWQKKNLDKCRNNAAARRARKKENGVFQITDQERKALLAGPCVACGLTENIHIDHIIPISRGGRHSVGNLQSLCASCNISKSDMLLVEWRTKITQAA